MRALEAAPRRAAWLLTIAATVAPCAAQDADPKQRALDAVAEFARALSAWAEAAEAGDVPVTRDDIVDVQRAAAEIQAPLQRLVVVAGGRAAVDERPARRRVMSVDLVRYEDWTAALLATDDPDAFDAALGEIAEALSSRDEQAAFTAIKALLAAHEVALDRSGYRDALLHWIENGHGTTQVAAAYALNLDPQPGDLARIRALASSPDPEVRASLSHLLMLYGGGEVADASEDIVLELLDEEDSSMLRDVLRGLWGASLSPRVQARLVALEREALERGDARARHDIVYFGLSTLPTKTRAVVDRLLEATTDVNGEVSRRALWGLGRGVMPDDHEHVARALADLHDARVDPTLRAELRALVERYGSEDVVEELK